ncbi:MAG: TIGR01906 family membrane protein [Micrococcaceae bacterium]
MAKEPDIFSVDPNYDPSESPILGHLYDDNDTEEISSTSQQKTGGLMSKFGLGGNSATETEEPTPVVDYAEPEKKPKLWARVLRVLIAVSTPLICAAAAIRVISSGLFLSYEYHRPGFPADTQSPAFNAADRLHYASYATDYLHNADGSRYLSDIVLSDGKTKVFTANEIAHMSDVKTLMNIAMFGSILFFVVVGILGLFLFRKHNKGGMVRGFFAGSVLTLGIIVVLTFFAKLNWESFFTRFHTLFFPNGNWQFDKDSTLIRLFPNQFWVDAGTWTVVLTAVFAVIFMILSWPTKARRTKIRAARKGLQNI